MICPIQSVRYDTSISFYNVSLGKYFHDNEVKRKHVQREVELSSPELSIMEKVPNQQYVEIRPIPFHNENPINYQLDNTGNVLVVLQPTSPWHHIVYPI